MGEMKVYCLDDCDFVATRGSVEDLIKWYSDGITDISEEEIWEVDLSREGMWVELTSSRVFAIPHGNSITVRNRTENN